MPKEQPYQIMIYLTHSILSYKSSYASLCLSLLSLRCLQSTSISCASILCTIKNDIDAKYFRVSIAKGTYKKYNNERVKSDNQKDIEGHQESTRVDACKEKITRDKQCQEEAFQTNKGNYHKHCGGKWKLPSTLMTVAKIVKAIGNSNGTATTTTAAVVVAAKVVRSAAVAMKVKAAKAHARSVGRRRGPKIQGRQKRTSIQKRRRRKRCQRRDNLPVAIVIVMSIPSIRTTQQRGRREKVAVQRVAMISVLSIFQGR